MSFWDKQLQSTAARWRQCISFPHTSLYLSLSLCPVQAVELPVSYQSAQCLILNHVVYFYSAVDVHIVVCNFMFHFFIIFMTTKCLRLEGVDEHVVSMTFVLFICHFFYDFMWLVLPWTVYTLKWAQTATHVFLRVCVYVRGRFSHWPTKQMQETL